MVNSAGIYTDKVSCWEAVLADIEQRYNITITVHDIYGMYADNGGRIIFGNRGVHRHPLCKRNALAEKWSGKCVKYCHYTVHEKLADIPQPFISNCPKKLQEIVVPVIVRGNMNLVVFAGPVVYESEEALSAKDRIDDCSIGQPPSVNDSAAKIIMDLLNIVFLGIISEAESILSNPYERSRKDDIRFFIRNNAHLKTTNLQSLASYIHLSESRTSHLVSDLFGKTFSELLVKERICRAKILLITTGLTAKEISERTGFDTPYYFSQVFKNHTKTTPIAYRKTNVPDKVS